uniref:Protein kintoun n=1 Tax=Gasterosteus aculeatus aculeatus TaxID=481459 RepID=A0AAQ4P9G8_GASAC
MEVGDKLRELNMTADEVDRLTKALKDKKFAEMLRDYADEISDPENRKRYEEEIELLEQERGNSIQFIHPEPFRCLGTSLNGTRKCFINICSNGKVGKPACEGGTSEDGRVGQRWSLPHSLHPGRQDRDTQGDTIMIYDVIFHPDTIHLASKNKTFMEMVDSAAIRGIQDAFKVTLDENNVSETSVKYKGAPRPCVIRKPIPGYKPKEPSEEADPLAFPYPDEKISQMKPKESHATKTSSDAQPKSCSNDKQPTRPNYTVKYRSFLDLQDFRYSRDSAQSPRPQEIVVKVDLPLLKEVSEASLEVKERQLLLVSKKPSYRLELPLSYPVDQDKGEAKFNKPRRQLTVTLTVLPSDEAFDPAAAFALTSAGDDDGREEKREEQVMEEEEGVAGEEEKQEGKSEGENGDQKEKNGLGQEAVEEILKEQKEENETVNSNLHKRQQLEDTEDSGLSSQQDTVDVSAEEQNSAPDHNKLVAAHGTEDQLVLITAEHSSQVEKEGEVSPTSRSESPPKRRSSDIKKEVATEAAFLNHSASEEPQTEPQSRNNTKDGCKPPNGDTEEPATGSVGHEEEKNADRHDLPAARILHKAERGNQPPPGSLREIDDDGNEKIISDHSTSAGFIFQNSLMYELD